MWPTRFVETRLAASGNWTGARWQLVLHGSGQSDRNGLDVIPFVPIIPQPSTEILDSGD
jgi:hypothetical protein